MRTVRRTIVRRLAEVRGYTLVELIVVCTILTVILGGLTTVFVSASTAQIEQTQRFQAQQQARLALDKIRREVHCASAITPTGQSSSVTLTLPAGCPSGSGLVTWCTFPVATSRYGLYRAPGAVCLTSGARLADFLVSTKIFNFSAATTSSRGKLHVTLPVNVKPSKLNLTYALVDDIILRNSART